MDIGFKTGTRTDLSAQVPSREDLAWVGGFYDGEGSCGTVNNGKKARFVTIRITQKNPELLVKIQELFGFGSVVGPYGETGKQSYRFGLSNFEHCQAFMAAIWGFIGTDKRKQFQRCFGLHRTHSGLVY